MVRPISCPICRKALPAPATDSKWFPFCSERCRNVDLLRWSRGKYAIVEELDPEILAAEYEQRQRDGDDTDHE